MTDMNGMFGGATSFNGDISDWNVSSVTDQWNVQESSFNGDISEWNVSSVTDMSYMFLDSPFNGNLGNWYIALDNAPVTGILQTVGNITTQNEFLATQGPTYGIGSSSDSEHFGINGTALVLTTIPDANPAIVNITSTGDFGTSNSRIFEITFSPGVVDTTNPRLESIERYSPASQNTNNQSLIYEVTFSESVTGVTSSDFILFPDSTGGGTTTTSTEQFTQTKSTNLVIPDLQTVSDTITVSDSGTVTSVSVAVDITHTYIGDLKIDLIAPDGTTRTLHNRSGGSTDDIDQTYAPSFGSIPISGVWTLRINDNYNADPGVLNSWTLTINHGSTATTVNPVTGVSGSDDTYYVTVSSSTDGTYNLDLVFSGHGIADSASNPLTNAVSTGADETYTVSTAVIDNTNPRLESIERYNPSSATTDSQTLIYEVTFSEDVTGVTSSDFVLSSGSPGGTGGVTSASGSGDTYYVTVSSTISGTYNLDLVFSGHGIADSASNPLTNAVSTGADETYTVSTAVIDNTNPRLESIERYNPSSATTDSQTLIYEVTFSEDVTGVTSSDFVLSSGSPGGTGGVTSASGSGDTYYVTVSSTISGTYNLDLVFSGHGIADSASNPLTNAVSTGADETYTVSTAVIDNTNPRLESIERYNPSSATTDSQTLIYEVTFSEDVTGVTSSDFVLSSGSPGGTGGVTSASGSGDTYYVTVSSTISGTYNLDLVSSGHGIADSASNP